MKILKNGSVKILRIRLHDQSYPGLLFGCIIDCMTLDIKYTKLSGKEKITINLSTDINGYNPTIISTGERWKDYQYDDAIEVFVKIKTHMEVNVVFFNKSKMKNVLLK